MNRWYASLTIAVAMLLVFAPSLAPEADARGHRPSLSEEEAVKLALASPEVREELSEHGPHSTEAHYGSSSGKWTVHFYVREGGSVGGKPTNDGRKEVARVGVDDSSWVLDYVWTGDQIVWQQARGEYGAYGKHANYPYVWLPLAL